MAQSDNQPANEDSTSDLEFFKRHKKQRKSEKYFWYVLIAASLGLVYFKSEIRFNNAQTLPVVASQIQKDLQVGNSVQSSANTCQAALPSDGALHRDNVDVSAYDDSLPLLEAYNGYAAPVVLLLGSPDFSSYDRTYTLHPGVSASQHVPSGVYSLTLLVGQTWCNFDKGFLDGKRIKISRPVEVIAGQSNRIKLDDLGGKHGGLHVDVIHVMTPAPIRDDNKVFAKGVLELHRQSNGGFYVDGSVNHVPVNYQVDTGASITSIPKELANRAGIFECTPSTFATANGSVTGCLAIAHNLEFGNIRLQGFQVAVMPNMNGVLLGMNVLRFLKIESSGDLMRISS